MGSEAIILPRDTNQARGLADYAIDFVAGKFAGPSGAVFARLEQFHLDSVACAVSAIALETNAPKVLRNEAQMYPRSMREEPAATLYGARLHVAPEKAVAANCAAVREWDANGTNFGYHPDRRATAGEFGHNDFYPVAIAAAQVAALDGKKTLLGMLAIDEIRGRLAEVFSLKDHAIDHVLHGGIASAAVYGAMVGATAEQIESAIGLLVSHYVPYRVIRAGEQLSDSKGASAGMNAEMAVLCVQRATNGFRGPADVFRNPKSLFGLDDAAEPPRKSAFDLTLSTGGNDFTIMGMHFKLGLYEHQSAGAIGGLLDLLAENPALLDDSDRIENIQIKIYEPAYGIICDPAKRDPKTRQSADHSIYYIIATLLRKAIETKQTSWKELMLLPADYEQDALSNSHTRQLMTTIEVVHGGRQFDKKYPDGIPTEISITHRDVGTVLSGLVMYPAGHARCTSAALDKLLAHKFNALACLGANDVAELTDRFSKLATKTAADLATINDFEISPA